LSGHRIRVVIYLILCIASLYALQDLLWPRSRAPQSLFAHIWSWGSVLWLAAMVPGTIGLLGLLAFRHPTTLDSVQPIHRLVVWRIVSYGKNVDVLIETIRRCQSEMAKTPLFPYVIEVVVDEVVGRPKFLLPHPYENVRFIWVPATYTTPNKSRFKARALHYAMKHSPVPDTAWVVFLDEETQPTSSSIKGICKMIREEEISQKLRVGQGAILYHRLWKKHPFLTLADMARTGDDFARFYFQHLLGITLFGLHGSFIVARTDVINKSGGFDFGPNGDITEDAFWALVLMALKVRSRWIEGYMEEQSTHSIIDFIKQRCRWLQGLIKVALHAPVKLWWRLSLGINTILWVGASLSSLYTICNFFYGFEVQPWIRFLANYSFSTFLLLYLVGLTTNMDEHGIRKRSVRVLLTTLQLVLLPIFTLMESAGVVWGLVTPTNGFHVVKK
jgi:egghead protein (zeste-white 4 protein)